ncbi:Fanconi anemia group D2 protein isoform X2 [Protopterus annectens]|nr:Fanconi anemia group D2 protein isoform X2 [Protopterus annectens]
MATKRKLPNSDDIENVTGDASRPKNRIASKKHKYAAQDVVVENETVFVQLLKMAGIILKSGNRSNEMTVDHSVAQKKLYQGLRKHPRYPNVIQEFVSGLEAHIETSDKFKNCLLPCGHGHDADAGNHLNSYRESLFKLLLGIDTLQPAVLNTLFEKLPEFMYESVNEDGINMPRLIISQFKWLDRIVDGKDLTSKLMQLIAVAPLEIQRDIITSLPEILEDAQHNDIGKELNSLLQQNTQLTVPILDTLSSLNLHSQLLAEIRQSVMSTLSAVELEDLPVVIKFILQAVSAADAVEVISEMRKKLNLESCKLPQQIQASQSRHKLKGQPSSSANQANSNNDCVALLLDVIKSAVRFQKATSEAWIKAVENLNSVVEHKVMDFLVLLILHTTNTNNSKKQVEKVLRNKIRVGLIQEQLLQNAFRNYSTVLRDYFPSILSLAQTLLRSADQSAVSFGSMMYKHAFTAFDSYCKQEVISALVTHVCSGLAAEVDISLDVLIDLVSQCSSSVALYAVFLKGILDYMENLSPQQIRKLFHILGMLAYCKGHEGSHIQDDMHIVIRKQLSSTISKYKRIGIIGAVMMVSSMSKTRADGDKAMDKDSYRQVTALLDLVHSCIKNSPEASALYYDEMANVVLKDNLAPQIMEHIGKPVLENFQDDYVVDLVPVVDSNNLFPTKALYNLDEEEESQGEIVINLLPLLSRDIHTKVGDVAAASEQSGRSVSPMCLAPFFRLLRLCEEKQHNGNLEEIDALLGCPIYLVELELLEKLEPLAKQEKEFLCDLLFYAINWFREIVNAFCNQKDPEMKGKVLIRLKNITELQPLLEKCLAVTPAYVPPLASFDSEVTEAIPAMNPAVQTKKGKKESGGGRKRKSDESKDSSADNTQVDENQDGDNSQSEKTQQEKENGDKEEGKTLVNLSTYRPYFRELDLDVFTILQCGLLTRSVLDTEMHTKATEILQLGPAELVFLLDDLFRKLEYMLISATKRIHFLKGKVSKDIGFSHLRLKSRQQVAESAVQLLNSLCNHLENAHNYFQVTTSENHGVVDGPGVDLKEYQLMSTSYQLLLQTLRTLFAWNGFSQLEYRKLLKGALDVLAGRLKEGDAVLSLDELVRQSFHYLMNFRSSVPNSCSALSLTQLLIVLEEKSPDAQQKEKIASLTRSFLGQAWVLPTGEKERGNKYNETLQNLLCIYLEYTSDVLKAIEDIAGVGIPELLNSAKDGCSTTYPTLTRQTFLVFYRVMMTELEKSVKGIPAGKSTDASELQIEKLLKWNLAVRVFHILMSLVKVFDSRPVLGVCLKYGRLFLETFLKLGMPLLDFSFKKHREDVQSLLKTLQLSTRQLHHMCGHSKIHQDTGLTNHVPLLKKVLEVFVYRVKAMLTMNNCQEAFWLGNLKNRDLQGEEILSQSSQQESKDEDSSEHQAREAEEEEEEDRSDTENNDKVQDDEDENEEDSD